MKKRSIRILALLMSLAMLLCACGQKAEPESAPADSKTEKESDDTVEAAEEEVSEWPEYLNLDSAYPIIKDEYKDTIKLSVAIGVPAEAGEWEDLWLSKYLKEKYNIELEVEYIVESALSERKNLMMNSGELPDMMWNMGFTVAELSKYGAEEGLLLACDEYIGEELTPNLITYLTDDVLPFVTMLDGHIYSVPKIGNDEDTRYCLNQNWLQKEYMNAAGFSEEPETLDEFVELLYAMKEANADVDGFYPVGGGMEVYSVTPYLLQALGYIVEPSNSSGTDQYYGLNPAIRDGEVVIPVYDMELYKEFLTLMKQFYDDGIINSSYFTIDSTESKAQLAEGKAGFIGYGPSSLGADIYDWVMAKPLTSEWQEEPEMYHRSNVGLGGFVISADTEYPELCLRLADAYFDLDECRSFWGGTGEGMEYDTDEYRLIEWDAETKNLVQTNLPEGYSAWTYNLAFVHGFFPEWGSFGTREAQVQKAASLGGDMPVHEWDAFTPETNPAHYARNEGYIKIYPYVAYGYPVDYITDSTTYMQISDIESVLIPYVKEQVAMFITGGRDLAEVDAFVEEMESMGMDELQQIYADIYEALYNK